MKYTFKTNYYLNYLNNKYNNMINYVKMIKNEINNFT